MDPLTTFLAWPGWAGVQGIASVIGVLSIVAVVYDYRQRVRESTLPGVGFEVIREDDASPPTLVTITARRGAVLYDTALMIWGPNGGMFVSKSADAGEIRPRWDHDAGALVVHLDAMEGIEVWSVGVVGTITTPLGSKMTGYRMPLRTGATYEQWHAWKWWQWRWWPRRSRGRWKSPHISERRSKGGPFS